MGVLSTYCQICGLPVQQDHYVSLEGEGYFRIWRGDGDDGCDPAIAFGPEHAWLRRAVGLRLDDTVPDVIVEGLVHDGAFEDSGFDDFLMDGIDERAALHRVCWEMAGAPDTWEPLARHEPPAAQEAYREQLFAFDLFVADGHGWMLADPAAETPDGRRNRQRITEILTG
jgi:hypothetical protein